MDETCGGSLVDSGMVGLNEAEFCAESATPIAVCLTYNKCEDADRKADTAKGEVDPGCRPRATDRVFVFCLECIFVNASIGARNNMIVQRPARVGTELVARGTTPSETERSELGTRTFSIGEEGCACFGHERETRVLRQFMNPRATSKRLRDMLHAATTMSKLESHLS